MKHEQTNGWTEILVYNIGLNLFPLPELDFMRGQSAGQNERQTEASCTVFVMFRYLQQLFNKQQQARQCRLEIQLSQAKLFIVAPTRPLESFFPFAYYNR